MARKIRASGSDDGHAASTTVSTLMRLRVVRDDLPALERPLGLPAPPTQLFVGGGTPYSDLDVRGIVCRQVYTHTDREDLSHSVGAIR